MPSKTAVPRAHALHSHDPSRPQRTGLRWVTSTLPLFAAFLVLSPIAPSPALGQDPPPTETESEDEAGPGVDQPFIDEIVVTSRRREENLQEIPVSVTAFDSDSIEQRSLRDLSDFSEITPNLSISTSGGFAFGTSEAAVFIRGVGQGDTAIFADPGVGIYVDGVYLSRAQGAILDLLDLDRVEVLRGPQGTLFGKNTTGGAISIITRRPSDQRQASVGLTIGEYDRLDGNISVDTPLTEHLRTSLAFMSTNRDGWSRSLVTGQDFYDDHRNGARLALDYQPDESFSARFSAGFTQEDENGGNQVLLALVDTPLLDFYNQALSENGFDPLVESLWVTGNYAESYTDIPAFLELDTWGTYLTLDWTRADYSLRSITSYRTYDFDSLSDSDGSPNKFAEADTAQQHYQISQELQLNGTLGDRGDFVAGAIYLRERPEEQSTQRVIGDLFPALEAAPGPIYAPPGVPDFLCNPGPPPPGLPCFGGAGNPLNLGFFVGNGVRQFFDLETESLALFGEVTWRLGDRLSLSTGLRFTEDRKTFDFLAINGFDQVTSDLTASDSWNDWSGRVSLAFQARPELLFFGTVARGFKSGGFNGRPQSRQVLDPFDPETVLSVELGTKGDFLDRRLRLNASAFWSTYDGIQFGASFTGPDGLPVFVTQNAGDADIWGFEAELQTYLAPTFFITTSLGYLGNELTEIDPRVPSDTVDLDDKLPKSPEWTTSISVQKTFLLDDYSALIGRVDYSWRSEIQQDFANTPTLVQPSYGLLGARLVYTPPSGNWDLALFGTNLADEQYLESAFLAGAFGVNIGIAGRPREWGLSLDLRF